MSIYAVTPLTLKAANECVKEWHRHHKPTQGGLFALGLSCGAELVGAAIVGRPVARFLQDGCTAEVTRLVVNPDYIPDGWHPPVQKGAINGCSMLYSAAWRACRALGYRKLITYILASESGGSLRASGWVCIGECGGGKWSRPSREREDDHPTELKLKWEAA